MLVLALDTSTPAVTAGVVSLPKHSGDLEVLAARVTVNPRAHGELLMPHVSDALRQLGLTMRQLDAIACGVGPGPFTGLRAGMVTAVALAHSLDIPAYPVCSLDAIAVEVEGGEQLLVVTDARRREVYWARYDAAGVRVAGPQVSPPGDVDLADAHRAAGYGAQLYADVFGLETIEPRYPTPRGLVLAGATAIGAGSDPAPLSPLYLRRPDAQPPGERKRVSA
ncbi:MAG: tRNA (adenosine(37)-N6)-threonylcarbamoyltransferase complex dimerization subunit type 1 TsaB [Haloechinothrix sp.]